MAWYNPVAYPSYHASSPVPFSHDLMCSAKRSDDAIGEESSETILIYYVDGWSSPTTPVDVDGDSTTWLEDEVDERFFSGSVGDSVTFSTGNYGSFCKITYDLGAGEVLWSVNFNAYWTNGFSVIP